MPPTSQNQLTIEADLRRVVQDGLDLDDDELQWRCEQAVRNHDPCISCAAHFLDVSVVTVMTAPAPAGRGGRPRQRVPPRRRRRPPGRGACRRRRPGSVGTSGRSPIRSTSSGSGTEPTSPSSSTPCARGPHPGTVHVVELGDGPAAEFGPTGHDQHARDRPGRRAPPGPCRRACPGRVVVVGIEGEDFGRGTGLSPAVDAALPAAVRRVVELIREVSHMCMSRLHRVVGGGRRYRRRGGPGRAPCIASRCSPSTGRRPPSGSGWSSTAATPSTGSTPPRRRRWPPSCGGAGRCGP